MEANLTATTDTTPAEENDDRYVAICGRIKVKGEALREDVFKAIENDDLEAAFRHLDTIQKIDRAYMLSLQRGMGIHEARKKREAEARQKEAAAAQAEMAAKYPAPETENEEIPKARRGIFERIFNR